MGSTDRLYLRHHPIRYLAFFWPHIGLAVALTVNGFALRGAIFDIVVGYPLWPAGMFAVAVLVLVSAVRPLSTRLQAATAAALMAVSVFRTLAYLQLIVAGVIPPGYYALVGSLTAHWMVTAVFAVLWPRVSEMSYLRATNAAGRQRGTHGVA